MGPFLLNTCFDATKKVSQGHNQCGPRIQKKEEKKQNRRLTKLSNSHLKFGTYEDDAAIQAVLWHEVVDPANARATLAKLTSNLQQYPGLETVSKRWVQRAINGWGWSWRKGRLVAPHKFTQANMEAYVEHTASILNVEWSRVMQASSIDSSAQ